jgi:flagellar basal body-associated protein FliL
MSRRNNVARGGDDDDEYDNYIDPVQDTANNRRSLGANKNTLNVPPPPPPIKKSSSTGTFKQQQQKAKMNQSIGEVDSLDVDTQKTLLKTFELFYEQESETMLEALEQSRDEIKNSMLDLCTEQEKYKEELVRASEGKYNFKRKKGNF